jgi:hypothetical protein
MNGLNKIECLSLAGLSKFVLCLQVKLLVPLRGVPQKGSTQISPFCKPKPNLERLARDKHAISFAKFINYCKKKFYNIAPEAVFTKHHLLCNLTNLRGQCYKTMVQQFDLKWQQIIAVFEPYFYRA